MKNSKLNLTIGYLYPDLMNIYGDRGNILCLQKRCQWREINVKIKKFSLKDQISHRDFDLLFAGGGQNRQQQIISQDLQSKKEVLIKAANSDKPMLTICGTYQLFGRYFQPFNQPQILGISLFHAYTIASNHRKIGNVIIRPTSNDQRLKTNIIGFENHSGNTFLDKNSATQPLGQVITGFGNNGQDKTEGAVYKNVFGTYLHGPVLPKNPQFTDFLIQTALEIKYQTKIKLKELDDSLENQAHQIAVNRAKSHHFLW